MRTIRNSKKMTHRNFIIQIILMVSMIISLIGCGGQGPSVSISSTPSTIQLGQSAVLTWSSQDADSVSINNGVGTVEPRGTIVVTPYRTTTYTISGVNANGKDESSVTVTVIHSENAPMVNITADPISIHPGEESFLKVTTINAYSVIIDNGIGEVPVNYTTTVRPAVTTTYTVSAIGPGGTSTASVTINVMSPPPSANITANPISIKPGESSFLEWSYANAHTVSIQPGIGDGTQLKSLEVSPKITTTYIITAVGPGGTATARVTVIVSNEYNPLQVHLEADPTQIRIGETSTLTWKTHNAARVWIEPEIGEVSLNGSMTVSPKQTITYIINASQNGHISMDSVTINVVSDLPQVNIIAEPETINPDESAVLTWQSQNADTVEIDQGIGNVPQNGSKEVHPLITTKYTITATGPGGVSTDSVTVNVKIAATALGNQNFSPAKAKNIDLLADYRLTTDFSKITDANLPEKMDWSDYIPHAKSQGSTGSGNAFAMAYYLKSFQESFSEQQLVNERHFSPMFTYILQCRTGSEPWDIAKTWKVLHSYGCGLWESLPFEDFDGFMDEIEIEAYANYSINDTLMSQAFQYRMGSPVILSDLDQIRMKLTQGPLVLAINHFDPTSPVNGDQNFIVHEDRSDMGHAVLCIGYDDSHFEVGGLKFINSWGENWAQNGISWIKYSDLQNILVAAISINDLPNKLSPLTKIKRPDAPENVQATDNKGAYVDISWTNVPNARYYKIFRAPVSSLTPNHSVYEYECIGLSNHSPFRDYSYAGDNYLYAIIAVNEIGESEHFNNQNDSKSHIDQGMAIGKMLETPYLSLISQQSNGTSVYSVDTIEPTTTKLQVLVSHNELGPWDSLGWIKPLEEFMINWNNDGSWTGYMPYVRIMAEGQSGTFSQPSQAVQVSSPIAPQISVAGIDKLDTVISDIGVIQLSWTLIGEKVDLIDIWRMHDSGTSSPWIKLDTVSSSLHSYYDTTAIAGIDYHYAVYSVFEGVSGIGKQTESPIQVPLNKPNLKISHVEYVAGALMEPLEMELTIQNNGNTPIEDYKFQIMAYNWAKHEVEICLEESIQKYQDLKFPLLPGNKHVFTATFDFPEHLKNEILFSWYVLIDSAAAIDEAYEEDNIFWAQKMCWMEMNKH
ncbi:sugar-binding protein [Candidatus Magnetomorum sp. HK-1]|nr:sugar-binding protein [Candidatus Magnetomorum sp. HK-1]